MRRIVLLALALATVVPASALSPYLSARVYQPWDEDIRATYRLLPELGLGVRSPRTPKVALDAGLSGRFARGVGEFSDFRFWDATGRIAVQFTLNRTLGLHLSPGVLYKYAVERQPDHDSAHNITPRDYGGSSIGFFGRAGVRLLRARSLYLDIETGMELVAVQTDRRFYPYPERGAYGWGGYYWLPLYAFDLGIVVGYDGVRPE